MTQHDVSNIAAQLKRRRLKQGLTQEQLAENLGCSPTYISKLESGKHTPSLRRLIELSEHLDCSPAALLR